MGVWLHIQRVDGRDGDLPIANIAESLQLFESIPWEEEIRQWDQIPDERREECRPLFQLFDDQAHSLHITAYSTDLIALAYKFSPPPSPFGLQYEDESYIGTDQFPRSELTALLECFYSANTRAMLSLLEKFPTVTRSPEP